MHADMQVEEFGRACISLFKGGVQAMDRGRIARQVLAARKEAATRSRIDKLVVGVTARRLRLVRAFLEDAHYPAVLLSQFFFDKFGQHALPETYPAARRCLAGARGHPSRG